jgi:hypothetical protein
MWHIAMPGAGAIHLINGGSWRTPATRAPCACRDARRGLSPLVPGDFLKTSAASGSWAWWRGRADVTYATDQREDILRAADVFLQHGVHIETGPHKHAIQGTFFLYVWEPAGNRVELANAGAGLILAPDWQPVVWTEADRKKGQAWGLKTIESFYTHGTPPTDRSRTASAA